MTVYALRLDNGVDTAARVRMGAMLNLPLGPSPLTSKSALRPDGGGAVTVVAGTMQVQAAPFLAWVQGSVSTTQGGYPFVSDSTVTLTLSAGHATLSRTDTIAGVVRDNPFDGSGALDARVIVVQGIPGAGAPTLPANCVPLRDVVVPAGLSSGNGGLQTSNLSTDRRAYLGPDIGTRISSTEYTAASGTMAVNAESGVINVTHNLGAVPSVVMGHLEDGAFSNAVGWRVSGRTTTIVSFVFLNRHASANASAVLRFRLLY